MKILLTGGAGFIGSHLARKLLQRGHEVTIIDSIHAYYDVERKQQQLQYIQETGNITFHKKDLLDESAIKTVFHENQFDTVIHLAALPGVAYSLEAPDAYVDYDIKATINVLKLSGETGVNQVIFASSSSVYGEQEAIPLKEEMATGHVVSPYAAAKYGAESFCHVYQRLYGFHLSILRFFTVYGPWGRPDMAIPIFIDRLLKGEQIHLYGEGTARDYTYIDDIVDGIEKALHHPHENETFNIGSGKLVRMTTLLDELNKFFPDMDVVQRPFRTGDVSVTHADITKAKQLLGYDPKVSVEEGIARTVEWFKKRSFKR